MYILDIAVLQELQGFQGKQDLPDILELPDKVIPDILERLELQVKPVGLERLDGRDGQVGLERLELQVGLDGRVGLERVELQVKLVGLE